MKQDLKRRAIHRSRILEGQIKALSKSIEDEDYCIDILTQSLAIQRSLGSLSKLVLDNHLRTHITDMLRSGHEADHEQAMAELLTVYELSTIRSK
ncbi:MAG: metal-sensitive transcriptional regulator [Candidatus Saccharimonadales bacterium]